MITVDHMTIEVPAQALHTHNMTVFWAALGFREVEPDKAMEGNWDVRWFELPTDASQEVERLSMAMTALYFGVSSKVVASKIRGPLIHLVAGDPPPPGLSHFCLTGVGKHMMRVYRNTDWLEHERQGSGRLWLHGPGGIRIEVRP